MFATVPAQAAPISDKRAEAARIKKDLDRLDDKLEAAVEDYNEALGRYGGLQARVLKNQRRLDAINAETDRLQTSLNVRVTSMYRSGPVGPLHVLLGAASFQDMVTTWDLLNDWNDQEAEDVAKLRDARAEAEDVEARLDQAKAEAKEAYDITRARKTSIENDTAKRKRMLAGVEKEIRALEAAERARALRFARAAAAARSGGTSWDFGSPTREPRGSVVEIAKRYLGRPYRWAASGPNSFDCSGFTMYVYSKVGVSLPHSSRAQINCGERVSRANLKPGDLVFFGHPIHHVGIYVGGGMMIDAPHSGDVVRFNSINRGNYAGACRP